MISKKDAVGSDIVNKFVSWFLMFLCLTLAIRRACCIERDLIVKRRFVSGSIVRCETVTLTTN